MKLINRFITTGISLGLTSILLVNTTNAQMNTSQMPTGDKRLATADVDTISNSDKGPDDARTSRAAPSIEDMPFKIPRPVNTEPFDYTSLRASNYDLEVVRISGDIKLDGKLSEEEWQLAQPAMNFYQVEPDEGAPATQPTEVRVLYDKENLYIGFMCFDSEPDGIMAPDMSRDTRLTFSNDMVRVVIAPLEGGREAYEFQTNPNGARTDTFVSKEGASSDQDWNGYWNAASSRHEAGWTAEFIIPFQVLRFPSNEVQNWSINFGRRIQRNQEQNYWVPLSRRDGRQALYRFRKGGRLVGLTNIKPGGRLQILPFSVLGADGVRSNSNSPTPSLPIANTAIDNDLQRQIGGDLKWSVTSGVTLNATVNPDFAQVEADDQVVNLSRFAFQFSEKRPFFLERSDIFSLSRSGGGGFNRGGGGGTPQLFFSRRVGRQLPDGSRVPLDLGMRLTGKVGRTSIGYFNAQSRSTQYDDGGTMETEPLTNWQALRVSQDVGARSSFGLLATFKEPNPGLHEDLGTVIPRFTGSNFNRVLGFDGNLAFRRSQHQLQVMVAKSWTDTLSNKSDQITWRVAQRWRNRLVDYNISYLEIGDNFIAQSGFVRQSDIRRVDYSVSFNPFIRRYGIRSIRASVRGNYLTNRSDSFSNPETWQLSPSVFFSLENGLRISVGWTRNFDTLSRISRIGGVHFLAGQYTYDQGSIFLFTNRGKKISAESNVRIGKFYGADLVSLSGELSIKPNPRLAIEPGLNWNRIERPDRTGLAVDEFDFNNRLIPRLRGTYSFTPNLSFTSFVQLNNDKKRQQDNFHLNTVTMNFLMAYRSPYGHSFFLAFNQFHDDSLDTDASFGAFNRTPIRLRDRQFVAKFSYLLNM